MKKTLEIIFLFLALTSMTANADDLLDTLQGKVPAPDKVSPEAVQNIFRPQRITIDLAKLNDPFQKQMYAQFEMAEAIPYDVQQWGVQILQGNYRGASHLWSVIQPQVPSKLQNIATAAQLYSLWKLGLNQTFFNQWTKNIINTDYLGSNAEASLEASINPLFDQWLVDNAIVLNPGQEVAIANLTSKNQMTTSLKAWATVRKGEKGEDLLNSISLNSPLRLYLAETAALGKARKGDLVGVARILKNHLQPIIEKQHDPLILAQYYMNIGRLLYQSGNLAAAKEYYEKVPNSSPQFLQAREELAWVLLRQGNTIQLRGEMKTLSSKLFDEVFSPDIYVVRAISNLKMCYYDSVQRDFDKFSVNNQGWAKRIDLALASSQAPQPTTVDTFTAISTSAVKKITAELVQLDELSRESISAALPAVGVQKHWKEAQADLQSVYEIAKKNQDLEYRRQWKNQKTVLSEAIRKMRFIKVEYLTQLRQLADGKLDSGSLVADQGNIIPITSKEITFPLDGEPWPDELFKLRSTAQGKCLKSGAAK